MKAYNVTRKQMLIQAGNVADNPWSRLRGLIGHRPLAAGEGLMITHCRSIHTFFMGFPIDVLYVSQEDQVVKLAENLAPHRIGPIARGASYVLELPAGSIQRSATQPGDHIMIEH